MGFSIAWLAVSGRGKPEVLNALALADTGVSDDANESPVSGSLLQNGWFVVFLNDIDHAFIQSDALRTLSMGCTVVGCQVEEHLMVSASFCFQDGKEAWDATHDSDIGLTHLEERGSFPSVYADMKDRLLAKQTSASQETDGVDYFFDVPVQLAYEVVGYRHDGVYLKSGDEARFTSLA